MKEFGLSQIAMGRIFSAFLLGYAFMQIPAGALADRFGARRVLSVATWLWVIITVLQTLTGWGSFASATTTALIVFMVFRLLLGIAASPTYPGSAQGVSRWIIPRFQGRANGIVIASVGLGSAITPPLVSNIMVHWGWRPALVISALPALVIALLWTRIAEPSAVSTGLKQAPDNNNVVLASSGNIRSISFYLLTISYTKCCATANS
jgi:ACS family glucarate transporter-like MFS transporter